MSVCLNYQSIYCRKERIFVSLRTQLIAATVLLFSLAVKVWVNVESTDLGYQLARERKETVALDMERRELELQLSVLTRPDNLIQRSKVLGLQPLDLKKARRISY